MALLLIVSCVGPPQNPDPGDPSPTATRQERRDVLLVTADTLRHDATGFSGAGTAVAELASKK